MSLWVMCVSLCVCACLCINVCSCVSVCEGCVPAPGASLQRGIKAISCRGSSLWPFKLPHSSSPICYLATGSL